MADITMPQLGETVTEGTITRWLKAVGDEVHQDEVLFEVSTDKVDSEVPSTASGFLAEVLVPEGETVDVGARLAVITEEPPAGDGAKGTGQGEQARQEPPPAAESRGEEPTATPPPRVEPNEPATYEAPRAVSGSNGQLLSPVVRRLMSEHAIDPGDVRGTGPGGRITRGDVLALVDARQGAEAPTTAQAPTKTAPEAPARRPEAPTPSGGDEVVPFTNIRRRTAEHMVRSKATSAHTLTAVEADFENIDRIRGAERTRFKEEEGISLTYLPFVLRGVVECLRAYPRLNASVGEDALILHHGLHIGIAVDLDAEGLIVPVIHDADTIRLPALAREIADLAASARSRRLTADDISGGTFTITNPGPLGTLFTVPIINQPQVAILSTDGIKRRPVVVTGPDGAESIGIHPVGILALSYDHRAIDGAYASAFLGKLREVIETRDWSQEL